ANAILLPYCMVFNREEIEERCLRLARYLGMENPGFETLLAWVLAIRNRLSVPHTLAGVKGMDREQARRLAPLAKMDATLATNPRPASIEQLEQILLNALTGNLA